ncbi:superoxide dismutase family protein [Methylophilus sp. 3sh_L]|uniref:superoxide dismutase family protein n=1 Tax=Methylophilus sp. 3sh_L TaxID=3377114 RepID=UPI00398E9CE5
MQICPRLLLSLAPFLLASCSQIPFMQQTSAHATLEAKSDSQVAGDVDLIQQGTKVMLIARVSGLAPNSIHGFHIHEKGDCSAADGTSAGGHFNPDANQHASQATPNHHFGDLPNLTADNTGNVIYRATLEDASLSEGAHALIGHAIIIHRDADDYVSQPAGNAGPRIACGVIK